MLGIENKQKAGFHFTLILLIIALAMLSCVTTSTTQPVITSLPTPENTLQPQATTAAPSETILPESTRTSSPTPILPSETAQLSTSPTSPLRVHFIDVGQGDAILIQTPDGKIALIDGGDPNTGIVQYLQSVGVQHIDIMIATHPHSDHIGGLVQVLNTISVDNVITNGQPHTTQIYERFLDAIATAKANYIEVKQGDVIPLGSINLLVLNPGGSASSDLNENSVVIQFGYEKTTFLMMGDAGKETEANLIASGLPLKADILKVGHHGSAYSSSPVFLSAVKPAVAVYSAGVNNRYNHPTPQTIEALLAIGAQVYGTDKDGSILVIVDPNGYTIETEKAESRVPPVTPSLSTPTESPSNGLEIVSVTSPVSPGGNATLTAKTVPGAACTITVYYKSGPSTAKGLSPKTANDDGFVTWTWKVGTNTTPGTWRIVVTATINDQTITQETTFTVR